MYHKNVQMYYRNVAMRNEPVNIIKKYTRRGAATQRTTNRLLAKPPEEGAEGPQGREEGIKKKSKAF